MKLLHKKRKTASASKSSLQYLKTLLDARLVNSSDGLSFQQIEKTIHECYTEAARQLIETTLAMYDVAGTSLSYAGRPYHKVVECEKTYQSLLGPIKVTRSLFRNKKHNETICPLEKLTGIVEGFWTPSAAKTALFYMTELPSEKTKSFLSQAGLMQPSSSSLDRLPKKINEHWESERELFEQKLRFKIEIPPESRTVAISLDGVMVPTRCNRIIASDSRYEEASCGTLVLYDVEGECIWKRQYGRMPERKKATLKSQLESDLEFIMEARPDLTIVKIADGARDNWTYFESLRLKGIEVLDFYHASEHLRRVFDIAYGENDRESILGFAKYKEILLRDENGIGKVITHIHQLIRKFPRKKLLKTERTYFQRHRKRAHYQQFKEHNLPIGSGIVEAVCKTLVTQRLKCSGMRWDYKGGQAIMTFRALSHSALFESSWAMLEKYYHGFVDAANDSQNYSLFAA